MYEDEYGKFICEYWGLKDSQRNCPWDWTSLTGQFWQMLSTLSVPDRTGACLLHHGFISVSKQWRNPDTTWAMVVRDKDNVLLTFSIVMPSASHKGT